MGFQDICNINNKLSEMVQDLCPVGGTGRLPQGLYGGTRCLYLDNRPQSLPSAAGCAGTGIPLHYLCDCHSEIMRCCGVSAATSDAHRRSVQELKYS